MSRKGSQGLDDSLKNSEDVVNYLIGNVYKQNKIEFYQNLDIKALEFLVSANFENRYLSHQDKVFVVTLIKQHPLILSIAFDREKFNFMLLFGFLKNQSTLELDKVRALEESFLPFCKKFPQKFIGMLARHKDINEILLRSLYLKNVFKIVYTSVFCLHNIQTLEFKNLASELINAITNSIFVFSKGTPQNMKYFDSTEVVINFNDFLADIALNLSAVEVPLILQLVELMNRGYIQEIISKFESERNNKENAESSEALIQILLSLLHIFETIKLNLTRQYSGEDEKKLKKIEKILKDNCNYLASKIKYFVDLLLEEREDRLKYSSGELIPKVTMVRYRVLELIEKILSINELENLKIKFDSFDFFPVIEYYLQNYKWNNIVHNLLLNIADLLISTDYKHFKERYIKNTDHYHEKFFGNIISNFRNKKFMFLSSIRMTNSGNQCSIYELSKMLVNEMKEQKDLGTLIEHFKLWKQFMEVDLKKFEQTNFTLAIKPENQNTLSPPQKKRQRSFDFLRSPGEMKEPNTRSLQTFEQILLKLKEEDMWSPQKEPEKISKKAIQNSLSRFDSMGLLQSQIQQ